MGSWNSKDGVWTPAKEKVVVYDQNGDPSIYEGPCREASKYLQETGETQLGMPFKQDPEIIDRAHDRHMTVDEFCKTSIHTDEKREKHFKEVSSKVINHKNPERKPAQKQTQTGGTNTAGGGVGSLEGGFSEGNGSALSEAIVKTKIK